MVTERASKENNRLNIVHKVDMCRAYFMNIKQTRLECIVTGRNNEKLGQKDRLKLEVKDLRLYMQWGPLFFL